jgi:hypothetical protein
MEYTIRKAHETDGCKIANTIALGFTDSYSIITKDIESVARALKNGIVTERFYVAEQNGNILGVIGRGDCTGRALGLTKKDEFMKHLGSIRGHICLQAVLSRTHAPSHLSRNHRLY